VFGGSLSKPGGKQLESIDVVRGFSILSVLGIHFTLAPVLHHPAAGWTAFLVLFQNGSYGVTSFFVASGFLITRMIDGPRREMFSPDKRDFYIRRVSRIFPMLLLVCAMGAAMMLWGNGRGGALAVTFKDPHAVFDVWFWLSIAFFVFNWKRIADSTRSFGYGLSWDVLWSLAIEEQFYASYPFLLARLRSKRNLILFLAVVILVGPCYRLAATLLIPTNFLLSFTASFGAFDNIATGVLAYLAWREGWFAHFSSRTRGAFALLGAALAVGAYLGASLLEPFARVWGPTVLAAGVGLIFATALDHPVFSLRAWAPIKILGRASYEAYLLHAVTLYLLWPYLAGGQFVIGFAVYLVVVTMFATAVHRFVEEPLKDRLLALLRSAFGSSRATRDASSARVGVDTGVGD
jgi:peptidoglycan/LPS O-acetylase OafA/YrhL